MRTIFGVMGDSEAIIVALGGTGAVASALGQSKATVSGWRSRGIPAGHWVCVVALAAGLGKSEITLEVLATIAARKLEEARA
jgi:hypothetical protein